MRTRTLAVESHGQPRGSTCVTRNDFVPPLISDPQPSFSPGVHWRQKGLGHGDALTQSFVCVGGCHCLALNFRREFVASLQASWAGSLTDLAVHEERLTAEPQRTAPFPWSRHAGQHWGGCRETPFVYRRSQLRGLGLDGLRGSPGSVVCGRILGLIYPRSSPAKTLSVRRAWDRLAGGWPFAACACTLVGSGRGGRPGEGSPEVASDAVSV